jgi:high-affinity iron transporter
MIAGRAVLALGGAAVVGVLVWQGITASGNPDPTTPHLSTEAAIVNTGVLVFREGLECILVLSAIVASMMGANYRYRHPITVGAAGGLAASVITWFAVVGIVTMLAENLPALHVQAATGLVAVIVLLVVMNWFFHKVYWTGWISMHVERKRTLFSRINSAVSSGAGLFWGLAALGFASVYREGFEVVLFLQAVRLQVGSVIVLYGVLVGLFGTGIVAVLTFIGHRRLPYKRMLVLTGAMLGVVMLVMVGEQAQEMQLAGWLPVTPLNWPIPDWMGLWFAVIPTVETIVAQAIAAIVVIGSYLLACYVQVWRPRQRGETPARRPDAPPVPEAAK